MTRQSICERLEPRSLFSTLPAGFTETTIADLQTTVAATMAFAPDGRLFVGDTTHGTIRVVKNGALLPTAALTLSVDRFRERGINGIAFARNFAAAPADQKYVFVYYTTPDPANPNTAPNNAKNRLSRFAMSTTNPDQIDPSSEKVLLDGIASDTGQHNGGMLKFGADGMLYLAIGDAHTSANAQDLTNLSGKVVRIAPDGSIPADNPFVNTPNARKEIWADGLRNPFTGDFKPGTNTLYVNDVGESTWEEIDQINKGANYGWPTAEGNSTNPAFTNPIYEYAHNGAAACITGGAFYEASQFPGSYKDKYFFGDYILHDIWTIDPATKAVTPFASSTLSVTNISGSPTDGSLYYLSVTGKVERISFATTQTTKTLHDVADAYVRDGSSAGSNFGQVTELDAKKSTSGFNRESYLKFDTSGAGTIGKATLRLFGKLTTTEASSVGVGIYGVSSTSWGENTITFSNKPAADGSSQASGTISGTTAQWYEFDVTNYVKQHASALVSFDVKALASALPIVAFNSDEAASNTPELVISPASSSKTLRDTADAYVRDQQYAGTNFGSSGELQVKKSTSGFNRESYLKFDLSSLSTINSAKLRLSGKLSESSSSAVRVAAFGVANTSWSESTIDYNNRPTGGTQLSVVSITGTTAQTYEWDLTSYLKGEKAAGHNIVTIALRGLDMTTPYTTFASDEAAANQPVLAIT